MSVEEVSVARAKKVATIAFIVFLASAVSSVVALPFAIWLSAPSVVIVPFLITVLAWIVPAKTLPAGHAVSVALSGNRLIVEVVDAAALAAGAENTEGTASTADGESSEGIREKGGTADIK